MSTDKEIEKLLGRARVVTTPEQDERILGGAADALPRPGRIRRLLPRCLAAAVLIGIVLGGFTARGLREARQLEQEPVEVADALEALPAPEYALSVSNDPMLPERTTAGVTVRFLPGASSEPMRVKSLAPMKIDEILTVSGGSGGGGASAQPGAAGNPATFPPRLKIPGVRAVDQYLAQDRRLGHGVGGSRGAKATYGVVDAPSAEVWRLYAKLLRMREAAGAVDLPRLEDLEDIGVGIRGLGGEKGPLVNLDDVTSGLEDNARAAFDREWRARHGPTTSPGGEEYDRIPEKPFLDPRRAPLSTFGIDVDTASYANVRRFLMNGQLPPANAVRIEEMVNYFTYDYPQPEGSAPFSVVTEVATCPWDPRHRLVHIGIQGRRVERENIPPRNLVFLLDVSGSMKDTDKLPLVKSAMKLLVGELGEADHVGIVTYAGTSGVALEPTNCSDRPAVLGAIGALTAGGSTNAGSGIQLAYEMARRNFRKDSINRVILATDGDFNVGITDRQSLEALITREREGGVFLTVLGVGTGNLKDSQLEMLADKGNGNYAYLDSILEAQKVLVREAGATLITIAKDVKIQVEFNPGHVGAYRLVGYENRMLAARDFNDDRKDAGEIGAGHSVTALYEIAPPGEQPVRPEVDPLRYQETPPAAPAEVSEEHSDEIFVLKLRYKRPEADASTLLTYARTDPGPVPVARASESFGFASAVATFGMLLRRSEAAKDISFALVEEIAAGALGEDPEGERTEFLKLVKVAAGLAK